MPAPQQPIPSEIMSADSTARVLDAVRDLHAAHQRVTRDAVQAATGLVMHVVDERLRVLTNGGQLRRVGRGEYEPIQAWPEPRPISKTLLPGGLVKIEIGDTVITLSPAEDRMLSSLQGGALLQLSAIETTRQSDALYSAVLAHMQRLERRRAS